MSDSPGAVRRAGLYAGAYLGPFGGGIAVAMLPELGATFGVSPGAASASLTAYMLPFALVMLASGTLGERWGRSRTVVVGYLVYAAATVGCLLAPTWETFLVARAGQGVANAFTTPLLLAALAGAVEPSRLGRALGWFGSLQSAGQTSAPLIGGLAAEVDWRLAFVVLGVVALALAAIGVPTVGSTAEARPRPTLRSAWRPDVVRAGVVAAIGFGCLGGLGFLVALRLQDAFALDAGPRGLALTGLGVAGILTARLIGGGVDRLGPRRCVVIGALTGAVLLVGVGLAPAVWLVVACWTLAGVPSQLILVGVNTLVLGSGGGNAGGAVSVVQALRFVGSSATPAAIPPIYHADPLTGFLVPAALLAAVVPVALPRPCPGAADQDRP